ncbi:D-alanyl-D-alanine carboxypeptidase family protein [Alicyclobacillus kakegawensis]|uniref:D-alanyl-D-alanine carboxypeptidase family protein n=1 Tax=Alicyclobacillus kakegawensis TaxID=392012 RepID=UPI000AE48D17|nr:D-alanyl-D-alanine carboxypeptidase family protein [Alicyclobacillus kakegawensis]
MGKGTGRFAPAWISLVCCSMLMTSVSGQARAESLSSSIHPAGIHVGIHENPPLPLKETADAGTGELAAHARSAVLMDFATGKVLFEKDAHERLPMASITKIMTLLLIMEDIDRGKIKLSDPVKASEYAASMGGSQVFLEPGEVMTVDDLIKSIAMASANDACVAMAEHLNGTEQAFVRRMNQRARELGMLDTHFANSNGLPAANHYSSAHDIALMSRELLKHSQITRWTSVYSDYLRKDTTHPLWLVNTNKLVRFYDGVDGLKTGYTTEAKYCLSATARRGDFRVIAIVMGEPKVTVRNQEVTQMLNWAFGQFESKVLYPAGRTVGKVEVIHGNPPFVPVKVADTVGILREKGSSVRYETRMNLQRVKAPIQQGQRVGTLQIYDLEHQRIAAEVPLIAAAPVKKAGFFQSVGQTVRKIVTFGH